MAPAARTHLATLVACLFFVGIFGVWLELNDILFAKRGVVFGPGYTETTTQLWVLQLLMVITGICGLSFLVFIFRRDWRIPAVGVAVFLIVSVVGTGIYPSLVQRFQVVPNEIVLEKPYLDRNIKYTRIAYGLKDVQDREFPAEENLTQADLRRNDLTIKNISSLGPCPPLDYLQPASGNPHLL